jgi:hypothetical protein
MSGRNEVEMQHLARLEGATIRRLQMRDLPRWMEKNMTILGRAWSFDKHEYQERILSDDSREVIIRKCSQVGISEISIRMALGLAALMPAYAVLYTFPTATFAQTYVKTRVDPVILGSPFLRAAVSSNVDSAEVKQIGAHGWVYFKGAQAGNAAISVAGDHLIHDELDFSDTKIIDQYHSRLTHSPYKRKTKLSTPTLPNGPIDKAFQQSRRHWLVVKCCHCGHHFIPDYYEHVKIPGYNNDLRLISKDNLHTIRYNEAQLLCPHCGKQPDLGPAHREWICENPGDNYVAVGYQVQPFDAPSLITLPFLVDASTQYERRVDFDNFNLGKPAEDKDNGLTKDDLERCGVQLLTSPFSTHVLGGDMGLLCRLFIGNITDSGELLLVHVEQVPIQNFKKRYRELCAQYRCTVKVLDSQPYVETVMSLQEEDANLYGAFYVKKEKLELWDTSTREENLEQGKLAMRQVQINKNKALDMLMDDIRNEERPMILIKKTEDWQKVVDQCTDMKRVKKLTDDNEFINVWVKSDAKNDHFHNALLYTWVAAKLRGMAVGAFEAAMMGVSTFKQRPDANERTAFGGVQLHRGTGLR